MKAWQDYPPLGLLPSFHPLHEQPHIDDLDALEADREQLVYAPYGLTKDEITLIEDRPCPPRI